ncbi:hypothetical protein AMELA_G00038040 [Ameiurus melas]|uniref:Uncharacterized protein n=1 Tax=Ameiurus melas TaxID=219545 RepID=A0A7J6B8Z0_AMEME|nr:hypothetical protein AMELA_G00038040 [Ameiurus melas]
MERMMANQVQLENVLRAMLLPARSTLPSPLLKREHDTTLQAPDVHEQPPAPDVHEQPPAPDVHEQPPAPDVHEQPSAPDTHEQPSAQDVPVPSQVPECPACPAVEAVHEIFWEGAGITAELQPEAYGEASAVELQPEAYGEASPEDVASPACAAEDVAPPACAVGVPAPSPRLTGDTAQWSRPVRGGALHSSAGAAGGGALLSSSSAAGGGALCSRAVGGGAANVNPDGGVALHSCRPTEAASPPMAVMDISGRGPGPPLEGGFGYSGRSTLWRGVLPPAAVALHWKDFELGARFRV